jgi:methionyl-tRNA synthetase
MALNLPLPKRILTHAHWTLGKEKMSKSTGNVVNPFFAIDRFGVDVMRYYLARDGGIKDDASYDNVHIIRRYNRDLKDHLGNLASRLMRSKKWNIREAVQTQSAVRNVVTEQTNQIHASQHNMLLKQYGIVDGHMVRSNIPAALSSIIDIIYKVGQMQTSTLRRPNQKPPDQPLFYTTRTLESGEEQPSR